MNTTQRISVFYGHVASNIGDLAINIGQLRLLREAFPGAEIHYVLLNSRKSRYLAAARSTLIDGGVVRLTHLETTGRMALRYQVRPAEFLEACGATDADLVVLASGEHLFYYSHGENEKSLFWRALPALAAKARGKRCIVLPSTFGPFEDRSSHELAAELFRLVDGFASRDLRSTRLVTSQFGINEVETLLDPAFFLQPNTAGWQPERPSSPQVLGLAVRSEAWGIRLAAADRRPQDGNASTDSVTDESAALQFSVDLARSFLRDRRHRVRFFVQTDADKALAERAVSSISGDGDRSRVELVRPVSVENYMANLANIDCLVASRFHALVLAMVMDVPVVGAYFEVHGHKIPGLFELLELDAPLNLSALPPEAAAAQAKDRSTSATPSRALTSRLTQARSDTVTWLRVTASAAHEPVELLPALAAIGEFGTAVAEVAMAAAAGKRANALIRTNEKLRLQLDSSAAALSSASQQLSSTSQRAMSRGAEDAKRLAALESELVRTRNAMSELQQRVISLRDGASTAQDRLGRAEKETRKLRRSMRYRAGTELAAVRSRPLTILLLPWRLMKLGRSAQGREKVAQGTGEARVTDEAELRNDGSGSPGLAAEASPEPAPALARDARPIDDILRDAYDGTMSSKAVARRLMSAAEQLADVSRRDDGCRLVQEACKLYPSESSYRALFWALQGAGRIHDAWKAVDALEALLGPEMTPSQAKALERLKSQPSYQLALRSLVGERRPRMVEPIAGRICYVLHNSLPYSSGGYATRAHGLATGLQILGHEVMALTRPGFPVDIRPELADVKLPSTDQIGDVRYRRIPTPTRKDGPFRKYLPKAADALEKQFRALQPEYVIAASNYMCALPALAAANRLGIPFHYEVRGFWEITRVSREPEFQGSASYKLQEEMEAFVCQKADSVVTLTRAMKAELVRRGVPEQKIDIVPNACDPGRFVPTERDDSLAEVLGIPDNAPVIGYVGTFVDYEGLDDLTTACGLLKQRGFKFRLLLVGNENVSGTDSGPVTDQIHRIASEYGITDWVIMTGRVPHDAVERYYSLVDIAPFPRKPWPVCEMVSPMKPLEALSMEKAVVVSSVDALAEMMSHGRYASMFEKGNVNSLADELEELIKDDEQRRHLGKLGRQYVERERNWLAAAELLQSALRARASVVLP